MSDAVAIDVRDVDFRSLFARVQPLLRSYRVRDEDAEDLLQEVAVTLIASFARVRNIEAWFVRCVQNRCRGYRLQRARSNARRAELEELDAIANDWIGGAYARARIDLDRLLARLPRRQRVLVELIEIGGYSGQEAGRLLGYAPGSVKNTISRLRRRLADLASPVHAVA